MGVNVVLLPAKTALLAGDGKASVVAVLSTSAMIVAAIANIIFGALSDLTRSRFGRRSPWIIGGSVLAAAAMMFVSWAPTVPLLIVGWCVYQCFLNAIVAPLIAVITDRTAPKFRGTISAMYALGYSVGIYGGQMIGARFLTDQSMGFTVLAVLTLIGGPLAALIMHEGSSLAMPRKRFTAQMFWEHFSFPTRHCRDYYLALFGKFLIVAAKFAISGFQLYILTDYMMQSADGAKHYVSVISMCMMVTAIAMTVIAGPISDRIGSRKIPVIACSLLVAVGSIIPFFSNDPKMMIAYALVAGTGMGAYNAVDQALNGGVAVQGHRRQGSGHSEPCQYRWPGARSGACRHADQYVWLPCALPVGCRLFAARRAVDRLHQVGEIKAPDAMIDASINQGAGGETWSWKLRTGPCRPHPDALRGQSGGRWSVDGGG
ncbi:MFS transporter [Bifidobacterium dentium]|uniref:MFS transporter n=1 Tax=Bifidobacterium dentium TaxID=1689 RepID=UPI001E55BF2F|nr:MFS transporter [Bifidobacterium dentium]